MPADIKILESHGCTKDSLKATFEKSREERAKTSDGAKVNALIDLHRDRMRDGISKNLSEARHWWAIDQAYDISHRQITFTSVRGLIDKNPSSKEVLSAAHDWGITSMVSPLLDKFGRQIVSGNEPAVKLDLPTFFNIFIPVVMAYTKIRWAKLFNDRDIFPLYKYEPLKLTTASRLKSEIITDRIGRMSAEMGYRDDERQSIFQSLLYGTCLNFPMEDYWTEKQLTKEDGKEKAKVTREGVRFAMPHPSKVFFDQTHRPSTFNFDNGADFAGYWEIARFGDVRASKDYWNRDKITWGGKSPWPASSSFSVFSSLYPCSLSFPDFSRTSGTGDMDREKMAFTYSQTNDDSAVNLVSIVHKLVPKDWGLYDYEYPVWHRFIYAGEDTCIHCVPLSYSPVVAYLYDYDNNRSRNPSLGQELLPWQDHLGNLLTQYLLSVKKNLTRVVFWNRDVLDDAEVKEIQNRGEKMYQELLMVPFSGKELSFSQTNVAQAFFPVTFPALNTAEIVTSINTVIGVMERMLGFSPQELGSPATHEQSATEVKIVDIHTSTRMQFTGGFIDQAIWARKKLLYDAMMAYSDDQILAEVADLNEAKEEALKKMGFEIEDKDKDGRRAGVKGPKSALSIEGFASEREGANRINDAKIAASMIQVFQSIFSNPAIIEAAGLEQVFDLFNQMMVYAGLPKDVKLRFDPSKTPQQNAGDAGEQLKQLAEQVNQVATQAAQNVVNEEMEALAETIKTKIVEPIAKSQNETQQGLIAVAERTGQIEEAVKMVAEKLAMLMQAAAAPAPMPPQPQPVPVPVPVPMQTQPQMMTMQP